MLTTAKTVSFCWSSLYPLRFQRAEEKFVTDLACNVIRTSDNGQQFLYVIEKNVTVVERFVCRKRSRLQRKYANVQVKQHEN